MLLIEFYIVYSYIAHYRIHMIIKDNCFKYLVHELELSYSPTWQQYKNHF